MTSVQTSKLRLKEFKEHTQSHIARTGFKLPPNWLV